MIKHTLNDGRTLVPNDMVTGRIPINVKFLLGQFNWEYIPLRSIGFQSNPIFDIISPLTSGSGSNSSTSLTSSQNSFFSKVEFFYWPYLKADIWCQTAIRANFWTSADFDTTFPFNRGTIYNLSANQTGFFTGVDFP